MSKKTSYWLLLWVFVWFSVSGLGIAFFGYWEMEAVRGALFKVHLQGVDQESVGAISRLLGDYIHICWLVLGAALAAGGLLLWVSLRFSLSRASETREDPASPPVDQSKPGEGAAPESTPRDLEEERLEDRRRALHLLSLLQREGRLVDFLGENLESYDDAQIGAAVRGIHENCQKAVVKYLSLEAVIDQMEGEEVTIPAGFDPSAVKLTGNVSGNPPFKGILQHRGWRATRFDLPTLSSAQDPAIIAPAEVEME